MTTAGLFGPRPQTLKPPKEEPPPVDPPEETPVEEPETPVEPEVQEEPETSAPEVPKPAASDGGRDYEVLALKYRPQTFSELIGQEAIARILQNAIRKGRIWNAFLFVGTRGVGKTSIARILAKALNCHATDGPTPEPCGTCVSCDEIRNSRSRDVQEIDGATTNSVAKVREIIEETQYAPARDRFRIYLVDEVHMLSKGAFNALLKTLEAPPSHVKFIFATTEAYNIPPTILSRCQEFEFRPISPSLIEGRIESIVKQQGFSITKSACAQLIYLAEGSFRDALSALDQVLAEAEREVTLEDVNRTLGVPAVKSYRATTGAILKGDRRAIFEVVERLVLDGKDLRRFVTGILGYLRDVLVHRVAPDNPDLLTWPDETEAYRGFASHFSEADLLRSVDVLARVDRDIKDAPEPRFHLEMALLRLVELPRLADFAALVDRLDSAPPSPAPPPQPANKNKQDKQTTTSPIARSYQESFGGEIVGSRPVTETDSKGTQT